jgi:hypothetical protein
MVDKLDTKKHSVEVWAQLSLSRADCDRIAQFFVNDIGVPERFVAKGQHITVYHSRRPMGGVSNLVEPARMVLYADETRFMVLAPGGENPRPKLEPSERKVGIRVHKQSLSRITILSYRQRLLVHETSDILGLRKPSSATRNAFGSRNFQPHMTLLKAGSGIDRDLTVIGNAFRAKFGCFKFDKFKINLHQVRAIGDHS